MIYEINGIIKFSPISGSIWNVSEPDNRVNLTITNNNLLCFFINNNGVVVSREDIFDNIWEKQGLHASNNTLNQYVSILRRVFNQLGIDGEIIKTVPKIGFCLSAMIRVEKEKNAKVFCAKNDKLNIKKNMCFSFFTIISTLVIFIFVALGNEDDFHLEASLKKIGVYGSCDISILSGHIDGSNDELLNYSIKHIKQQKWKCTPGKVFLYDPEVRVNGAFFFAECISDNKRDKYYRCNGFYIK